MLNRSASWMNVGVKLKKQSLKNMYTMRDVLPGKSGASFVGKAMRICRHEPPLYSIT